MLRADFIINIIIYLFYFTFRNINTIMEKSHGAIILLLALISLIHIAILQNQGGGLTDERVKSAVEEILRKVRGFANESI